ncbi:catechol 2,3-dioxygenase-like lactoylglutathione lyase family enzyme [Hamadaea flava]|uniref:VOC family protein n=1 Tax=Hamadaea flava TaxID=1742688 RepID=A0ABV8LW97_9ACTN|nr:VOC family protein [Hamadaea flava]MCP2327368.1 catechol 2,3-dioxygenase-like lactoylglutathione lyase family enzyme [Hamadaea flava]
MANGQRKKVGAVRATGAVALGSLGVFTAMAGLGLTSWPLGAVGVAMLILAVALMLTSSFRGADRAFVVGTAHVLEATEPPATLTHGRIEMHLQIEAPGHPPASVRVRDPRVPVAKWPTVGDVLPVRVAVDDIRRVRVLWDEILTHTQRYQDDAYSEYEGLIDDEEPLYDDRTGHQAGPMRFEDYDDDDDREDLAGYRDSDLADEVAAARAAQGPPAYEDGPEGPDLPLRRRPSPRRRGEPRRDDVREEAAEGAGATTQVLEGQIIDGPEAGPEAPLRVDVIDFSEATPSALGDLPPNPRTSPENEGYLGHAEPPVDPIPAYSARGAGSVNAVGVTLLVADVDRSVAFYRDLLGFDEIDSGYGNAVMSSGDTRIVLRRAEDLTAGNRRLTHLNLEVDDLDRVHADLVEQGVTFTYAPRVVNRGERLELWAAAFRDPDGHAVNLTQWRSRH